MTTYARRLGLFSGTMAVVGGIIGGGIFRTPATVAERLRSPGLVLLAWVVGGVVALIGAFCFGELGRRYPRAGGGYGYLRESWGRRLATDQLHRRGDHRTGAESAARAGARGRDRGHRLPPGQLRVHTRTRCGAAGEQYSAGSRYDASAVGPRR